MTGLEWIALAISSLGTTTLAANLLYLGTYALAIGGAAFLALQKPSVPKAEDGTYSLKQNVPSLTFVMGWAKKGGDYVFLEEASGDAYHIVVQASHEIQGYIQHYLHDEKVTLDVNGKVVTPTHFGQLPIIKERLGLNAETAYSEVIAAFPTVWTADHRGDGLASILMIAGGPSQKSYLKRYPNGMPELSSVIAGAKLYDPRTEVTAFSRNLSLMRLWHLTHPVGGKLTMDDMYLPEWENAANVSDVMRPNRDGVLEPTYHGGFWFRANNDPVEVGRIMDQAAEMVVYERPDGLVGVHAGEYVEPDITLTADDLVSVTLDANSRDASNVLAVRGRYTRLDLDYNVSDAAIYGDPYVDGDDTERTKTIENQAIQSHNHVQRLQKLAFIRANAPRVTVVAHYESAEDVPYRRFVRVDYPPKLDNVVLEIVETPKLSLRNLTIEFTGIVVPTDLYAFDAATEEGEPGNDVVPLESGGVPTPTGFDVTILADGPDGAKFPYGKATWTHVSGKLLYELEWQPTDLSDAPRSVMSEEDEDQVRSGYLSDGKQYRFRLRAWGGGSYSDWTSYVTKTAVGDTVAPLALTSFTQTAAAPHLGNAVFSLTTQNDAHLKTVKLYRKASGVPLNVAVDTPITTLTVASSISATYGYTDGDTTRTNLITNGDFASDTVWSKGTGWTISGGKANKAAGTQSGLSQAFSFVAGTVYRLSSTVSGYTAGTGRLRFTGTTTVNGVGRAANGTYLEKMTAAAGNNTFLLLGDATFAGSYDDIVMFPETVSCAPQGDWDYYAVPFNASGVAGPATGPVAVTMI